MRVLRQMANVVSFGPRGDYEQSEQDIVTGLRPDVRSLWPELEKRLGGPVDWLLYVDPCFKYYLPRRLEQAPCPSACILIDTVRLLNWHRLVTRQFDLIFQYSPSLVEWCARGRQKALWGPGAADERIYRKLDLEKKYNVGFVGQFSYDDYSRRAQLIKRLQQRFNVFAGGASAEDPRASTTSPASSSTAPAGTR